MWMLSTIVFLASLPDWSESYIRVYSGNSNESLLTIEERTSITYSTPPDDGALGRLVIAAPVNACTTIPNVPYPSNDSFSWFLLVRRYDCTFYVKLTNAQRAGYAGVIVYDSDEEHLLARPFGLSDISIYAVLISKRDGRTLQQFTYDEGYLLEWYPTTEFNLLGYIIPCIIIVLLCIIMISSLVVAQHCARWYRERRRNARYRLAKKYLKQLPVKKWTKGSPEFERYESCSICLDEYQEGDKLRVLPCSHAYHAKCIDPWLTKNRRVCPLCKRKIILPGMPEDSSDDETAPLLSNQHDTGGGTFRNESPRPEHTEIEDVEGPAGAASSSAAFAPGGHYSLNDEVEVLPRRKLKKKKRSRRHRPEPLDDATVAGPSTSAELSPQNQMVCVTQMGSDDEQQLL
ncbi:E3 ubiquitin-protein ligase RNF13 isoform X2 [Galendromus occidentalis]|uniref:RING-type E3 ubiquitin transferase n=1 Tax=Galendromus occidentalis TaxID=34638 RepID=A0AAJ7L4S3_9ACAR|nr:E3 ubiquitin-protein ligase RNF13 isoform X2 [Galendromus occidentalis]